MSRRAQLLFLFSFPVLLLLSAFALEPPAALAAGLGRIIVSPSLLLTDYLAVGGRGATLLNAGLCGLACAALVVICRVDVNGPFLAAVYTVIGFAFFGKNILNIWPIFAGVWLHTRYQGIPYRNALLVALFGTTLAPLTSFFAFAAGLQPLPGVALGTFLGLLAGVILPPMASHMLRFHDGYNIYNIGFTGGIIGSFVIANMRSFEFAVAPVSLLCDTWHVFFAVYFTAVSAALLLAGLAFSRRDPAGAWRAYRQICRSSGRLVSDFTAIGDYGSTVCNMGIMGLLSVAFVLLLGGTFNGPVIGGLLTVVGFAAFGKHPPNCLPVLAGVVLASLFKVWDIPATTVVIAGLFGTTLAPIAGQYGPLAGLAAGFFHLSVVMNVGVLHGGINLYNNGFAGGFVAAFLVPVLDFLKRNGAARET